MRNNFRKRFRGVSILEVLLMLTIAALGFTLGFKQYYQYKRAKDLTQIQQSVNQLLQAGAAYYYVTCKNIETGEVALQNLQAIGVLPNVKAVYNPWGNQPFQVWIISGAGNDNNAGPPYLIQVRAYFPSVNDIQLRQIANQLGADGWSGGLALTWTRLPSQVLKQIPFSVQSPGGWVVPMSGTTNGGRTISSNLQIMDTDLAVFSKYESGRVQGGFTCPD